MFWIGYYAIWILTGFATYSIVEPQSFLGVIGFLIVWAIVGVIGNLLLGAILGVIARSKNPQ